MNADIMELQEDRPGRFFAGRQSRKTDMESQETVNVAENRPREAQDETDMESQETVIGAHNRSYPSNRERN